MAMGCAVCAEDYGRSGTSECAGVNYIGGTVGPSALFMESSRQGVHPSVGGLYAPFDLDTPT